MCEEPHCPDPLPEIERVSFVLALLFRKVDFEDRGKAVGALDRQHKRDIAAVERAPQPKLPYLGALRCQLR